MVRRAGTADLPPHSGHPKWLADRMTRLGAVISEAIVHHYGCDEPLWRLAHSGRVGTSGPLRPKRASLSGPWPGDSRTPASRPSSTGAASAPARATAEPKAECADTQRPPRCRVPGRRDGGTRRINVGRAARRLTVSKMTVLRLIGRGAIQARQVCKGAPWAIPAAEAGRARCPHGSRAPPATRKSRSTLLHVSMT
jgi:hypothetical protein